MAARQQAGRDPWDNGCKVKPLVDGLETMNAIRDGLEAMIAAAPDAVRRGADPGHVYLAGWQFNAQRDLSVDNAWKTGPWSAGQDARADQTLLGLLLRAMQAGIKIRMLAWYPTKVEEGGIGAAQGQDHLYMAKVMGRESERLGDRLRAIVALDCRVADRPWTASHHQKLLIMRSEGTNLAFTGGVDLAFLRRNTGDGDWQSGLGIPEWEFVATGGHPVPWPQMQGGPDYATVMAAGRPSKRRTGDLIAEIYGAENQIWLDKHLMLMGPIVQSLEEAFRERWVDSGTARLLSTLMPAGYGDVLFSTDGAYTSDGIAALPPAADVDPIPGGSVVQMWRTIPERRSRTGPLYQDGEFTVVSGLANAIGLAQKFIWIYDQYFWNLPLARLMNARLRAVPGLRVIIVLPPWADGTIPFVHRAQHRARQMALDVLRDGVADQVKVYNAWTADRPGRGAYLHAKMQMFDGTLLACGSANLNLRSALCDTELVCATSDASVVLALEQRLWLEHFGKITPTPDFPAGGTANPRFFELFAAAAAMSKAALVEDPAAGGPPLPNNQERVLMKPGHKYDKLYRELLDPSSIGDASVNSAQSLDQLARRLEDREEL
jgi:phosphatidylserine/phosphatidylglycerophosphate/cardiolipin synthase-like enzyme